MIYEHITIEREESLAVITIRREKVLNALNEEVLEELIAACAELEADTSVRTAAITGAGRAFVAGADIAAMREMTPPQAQAFAELGGRLAEAIESSRLPFIAAVGGFALGGGCELALACDFIYASAMAKFGQPEVKLGVVPGFGGTQRLARRIGVGKARELILTGEKISADEALRIRLVDAVFAPDELMDEVRATAAKIGQNDPLAVAEAKRLINVGQSMTLEQAVAFEQRAFAGLFATADELGQAHRCFPGELIGARRAFLGRAHAPRPRAKA